MKTIEKTKHSEALLLEGYQGKSYHAYIYEKDRMLIDTYRIWYWDGKQGNAVIIASNETKHKFSVLLNRKKARVVIKYSEQEYALDRRDSGQGREIMQGVFFLMWKECEQENAHCLWIVNQGDDAYSNINMDIYGYEDKLMRKVFQMLFETMAQGFPQIVKKRYCELEQPEGVSEKEE